MGAKTIDIINKKMKKFDIKKAKKGNLIVTKKGKDAKILLFDRDSKDFPLVVIIENKKVLMMMENFILIKRVNLI